MEVYPPPSVLFNSVLFLKYRLSILEVSNVRYNGTTDVQVYEIAMHMQPCGVNDT